MRPVRIKFDGYRRLAKTSCDISPRVLALVGRNEAGKSSVLSGLVWHSEDGRIPLGPKDRARSRRIDAGPIVTVTYRLEDADTEATAHIAMVDPPSVVHVFKNTDGSRSYQLTPRPRRHPEIFESTRTALASALDDALLDWDSLVEGRITARAVAESLLPYLSDPDDGWDEGTGHATSLWHWIQATYDVDEPDDDHPVVDTLFAGLSEVVAIVQAKHPSRAVVDVLSPRIPKFVLFGDEYRALPTRTEIDAEGHFSDLQPSIGNLLNIAGIDRAEFAAARRESRGGDADTILRRGNERLNEFFGQAWNQNGIGVRFTLDGSALMCYVNEIEHVSSTDIEERSDGLRAFIALAAFVEAQRLATPPVLLIDEAETHLHLDAQADLVSVMMNALDVSKVIYTTHSPGCLPSDLGTGIRLVRSSTSDRGASVIDAHFWTNTGPGFSPLLYAMGAGAAAFSACRRAVLAEGASEMIMLPTLLRQACGRADLGYQVAQGVAQGIARGRAGVNTLSDAAAKVVYLLDGDGDGARYKAELRDFKIPARLIKTLPEGWALEDLLEPEYLLTTLAELRKPRIPLPSADTIAGQGPIMTRLQQWAAAQTPKVELASKTALAYRVIEDDNRQMTDAAVTVLKRLDKSFITAFGDSQAAV